MRAGSFVRRRVGAVLVGIAIPAGAFAQTPAAPPPQSRVSMADAVRLALAHNH